MLKRLATTSSELIHSIGGRVKLPGRRRVAVAAAAVALAAAVAIAVVPSWRASPTGLVPGSTAPLTDSGGIVDQMESLSVDSGWALVYVPSVGHAWQHLMFTDDAGATWRDATPPGLTEIPTIDFLDPEHGWVLQILHVDPTNPAAAIPSSLWRTSDGGRHWVLATLPRQDIFAATISFIDPDVGYLAVTPDAEPGSRQTILYATVDGGASWTNVGIVVDDQFDSQWAHPLVFLSQTDGLFVTRSVRQTHDGGRSWKPVSLPRPPEVPASAEVSVGDYVVAGNSVLVSTQYQWTTGDSNAAASGYEFISRDQGHTWSLAWSGAPGFDSGSKVVAVNETTLFRFPDHGSTIRGIYTTPFTVSDDGGRTWTSANAALPSDTHFDSESFVNALDGWAILSANQHCPPNSFCPGPSPSGRLAETNDGGRTWRLLGPTENLSAT